MQERSDAPSFRPARRREAEEFEHRRHDVDEANGRLDALACWDESRSPHDQSHVKQVIIQRVAVLNEAALALTELLAVIGDENDHGVLRARGLEATEESREDVVSVANLAVVRGNIFGHLVLGVLGRDLLDVAGRWCVRIVDLEGMGEDEPWRVPMPLDPPYPPNVFSISPDVAAMRGTVLVSTKVSQPRWKPVTALTQLSSVKAAVA